MIRKKTARAIIFLGLLMLCCGTYSILSKDVNVRSYLLSLFASSDYKTILQLLLYAKPSIENRPYYGDANAPITIVAYLDIDSTSSKLFYSKVFPSIEQEYILTGKAKFFHKNRITSADLSKGGERFKYMTALSCVEQISIGKYYPFYFGLLALNSSSEIFNLVTQQNMDLEKYTECIESGDQNLIQDLAEVELFGMTAINPRVYIGVNGTAYQIVDGVADYSRYRRLLRNHQILIGD